MTTLRLKTEHFELALMTPDMVTEAWAAWSANPALMKEVNARPQRVTRDDLKTYLMEAMAKQRAVLGVFSTMDRSHVGVIEIVFDQSHFNMNFEVLIDFQRHDMQAVLNEVMPPLLDELKRRFGAEKAVMIVPETSERLLGWLSQSSWIREGLLRLELPHATDQRRINAIQYGLRLS